MVHRTKQKPSLYVTHDQTEALAIGDRIAIIAKGKLQQVGPADDLIRHPANMFVAGFIGTPAMNLLPGTVIRQDHQVRFEDGTSLKLPATWNATIGGYPKDNITVGIPPSAFLPAHLEAGAATESLSTLNVQVEDIEPLVSEMVVTMKLPSGTLASAIFQGMDEDYYAKGKQLSIQVDGEQLCLFDPDTEVALRPQA
jgi:ABC-type sugar transport system ATPase subunit